MMSVLPGHDLKPRRMTDGSGITPEGAKEVTFKVSLKKGITELAPVFIGPTTIANELCMDKAAILRSNDRAGDLFWLLAARA